MGIKLSERLKLSVVKITYSCYNHTDQQLGHCPYPGLGHELDFQTWRESLSNLLRVLIRPLLNIDDALKLLIRKLVPFVDTDELNQTLGPAGDVLVSQAPVSVFPARELSRLGGRPWLGLIVGF